MESSEHGESFLTVAEVAEMLKLNQQTVRNWIDQGSLPALRVGRRVRIKRSDFERVLEDSYSSGIGHTPSDRGPSAEDFWGGTPVGLAEPDPQAEPDRIADPDPSTGGEAAPLTEPDGLAGRNSITKPDPPVKGEPRNQPAPVTAEDSPKPS